MSTYILRDLKLSIVRFMVLSSKVKHRYIHKRCILMELNVDK